MNYITKAGVKLVNEMREDFNSPIGDFKHSLTDLIRSRTSAPRKPLKRYRSSKKADPRGTDEPYGRTVWTGLGSNPGRSEDRIAKAEKDMTPAQIKIMNAIKAKEQAAQHDTLQRVHPSKVTRTRKTSFDKLPKNPDVFFPGFGRWEDK